MIYRGVDARELEREQDIEHLRRIALAQHAQIEQLIAALARKCTELEALKGSKEELQQTLKLIEQLKRQLVEKPGNKNTGDRRKEKPVAKNEPRSGPTPQTQLPTFDHVCTLPAAELVCSLCGNAMHEMDGQFEESELVDVVEVEYHVKQVRRQKYACRCGGCIKTAPGPARVPASSASTTKRAAAKSEHAAWRAASESGPGPSPR